LDYSDNDLTVGKIEIDSSMVGPSAVKDEPSAANETAHSRKQKVTLDSKDTLYADLRDSNFASVGNTLNKLARKLHDDYEGRHQAKTISEVRKFVNKMGGLQAKHQSLRLRMINRCVSDLDTNLAENIMLKTQSPMFNKILEVQQSKKIVTIAYHRPNSWTRFNVSVRRNRRTNSSRG